MSGAGCVCGYFRFPRNSAADSPEQIVANPDEATTSRRLSVKSTVGRTGGNSHVLIGNPLPVSRGTGPVNGATPSRAIRGIALLGATCSRVRGIGLLGSRVRRIALLSSWVVRGIALLSERERGGCKRYSNREAQGFHPGHFVFLLSPTTR